MQGLQLGRTVSSRNQLFGVCPRFLNRSPAPGQLRLADTATLAVNPLLHATLQDISDRREWAGRKWEPEVWKRLLTAAWMRARGEQVMCVPALDGHGVDVVFQRTSKLSKAQMAELIDFIQAWDAQA